MQDIGIATFLMLLWKDTFGSSTSSGESVDSDPPWQNWPRPPGGFLDLGWVYVRMPRSKYAYYEGEGVVMGYSLIS